MRWQERELLKDWSIRCWQALSLPRLAFIHSLVWNFYLFCAFASRGPSSQSYSFSSSHVWIWETVKKAERQKICASWTVVLEKTLESPLDLKEIKPVNPNGNQSWIFIQGLMLKVECQYFGHLMWRASSVQLLSHVRLFAIPWTTACQASLSITKSWSLPKLMSIQSVMPSNHPILCHPLLCLPSIFPSIRVFSNESTLHMRWPKY